MRQTYFFDVVLHARKDCSFKIVVEGLKLK